VTITAEDKERVDALIPPGTHIKDRRHDLAQVPAEVERRMGIVERRCPGVGG